jgi:hypothetical protein
LPELLLLLAFEFEPLPLPEFDDASVAPLDAFDVVV